MAEIQITTTQNVNLDFKSAELNHRMLAWFIDFLIKLSYIGILGSIIYALGIGDYLDKKLDDWSNAAIFIMLLIPVIFYTLVMESFFDGQTLGKKVMKLKVLKIDGYQTGFIDFFIRWVMRIVDINSFFGVIGLVFIGVSKKAQRLGGMASGTAVVSLRNNINVGHTILDESVSANINYKPTYPSVVRLSDNDVRIIKENYLRAVSKNNNTLLLKLKEKIIIVIGQEPILGHNATQFIDVIIKGYNYYTQNM